MCVDENKIQVISRILLFGRVGQLIFSPSVVALCDALVVPQVLHRLHVGRLKRRHRLEVDGANQVRAILQKRGNGPTLDLSYVQQSPVINYRFWLWKIVRIRG